MYLNLHPAVNVKPNKPVSAPCALDTALGDLRIGDLRTQSDYILSVKVHKKEHQEIKRSST